MFTVRAFDGPFHKAKSTHYTLNCGKSSCSVVASGYRKDALEESYEIEGIVIDWQRMENDRRIPPPADHEAEWLNIWYEWLETREVDVDALYEKLWKFETSEEDVAEALRKVKPSAEERIACGLLGLSGEYISKEHGEKTPRNTGLVHRNIINSLRVLKHIWKEGKDA